MNGQRQRKTAALLSTRAALALAIVAGGWERVGWYGRRLSDGGDEPWGLVALVAAVLLTPRRVWRTPPTPWQALAAGGLILGVALFGERMPALLQAMLWILALACVLAEGRGASGRTALLGLSLPVVSTLQFYAGYPLRVVIAEMGRWLLAVVGIPVERMGVVLRWSGGEVMVDAPCSGVRMLWTASCVAAGLAAAFGLRWTTSLLLAVTTLAIVVVVNGLRATLLFFTETGRWANPEGTHSGIGVVLFTLVVTVVWRMAARLGRSEAAAR